MTENEYSASQPSGPREQDHWRRLLSWKSRRSDFLISGREGLFLRLLLRLKSVNL